MLRFPDFYKVAAPLFTRAGPDFVRRLRGLGKRVFLDLKYHDIPNTVAGAVRAAVHLRPPQPQACADACDAVRAADWVVLGPGSWFTSVIPHLLVPDLRRALVTAPARRAVTLNLAPQTGETEGFSPEAHLEVLGSYAPDLKLDVVLADERTVTDLAGLRATASAFGAELVVADVAADDGTPRHDPVKLANAYASFLCEA